MRQSIGDTHGNAVAAEKASAVRNLLRKSPLIEIEDSGRTNLNTRTVSLAQTCINPDLSHVGIPR
jgi:hypothetical protein